MPKKSASREKPRSVLYGPMLIVHDIGVSFRFYRDMIGLQGESTGPWAEFSAGEGNHLVLLESSFWARASGMRIAPDSGGNPESPVITIQVPNVTELHGRMVDAGVQVEIPPTEVPQLGNRITLVRDPDGHHVELSTMLTRDDFERMKGKR